MHHLCRSSIFVAFVLLGCTPPEELPVPPSQMQAAAQLESAGDLEGAERAYAGIASDHKTSVDAEIALAEIYHKTGHPQEAVTVMEDAIKRQPHNEAVEVQLGYALIAVNRFEEAVTVFDTLIEQNPANSPAYNGKAVAFDKSGNHLAAQDLYEQALALSPDSITIRNNMAMSFILNHQLTQAEKLLQKLLEKVPDNKTVRQNLALVYGLKGERAKALAINEQDMSEAEAKNNLKFYEAYARHHTSKDPDVFEKNQIGFEEAPKNNDTSKDEPE